MDFILDSLRADWQAFLSFSPRLIYAAVVLVISFLVARHLSRLLGRVLRHSDRFRTDEKYITRLVQWTIRIMGIVLALSVMGFQGIAASMLATGGVVAIVLGFAFREIGENLLAGIFLSFGRPFEVGDLVTTGDLTGTVKAIDIRSVHIRTFDACDVFVPSAQILREALYNYTRDGVRRPSFTVGMAYDDDPEAVVRILKKTISEVENVLEGPEVFVSIQSFSDAWITYECFFWIDVNSSSKGMGDVTNEVKTECWKALGSAGMTFSTDVTSGLDIKHVPALKLEPPANG